MLAVYLSRKDLFVRAGFRQRHTPFAQKFQGGFRCGQRIPIRVRIPEVGFMSLL